MWKHLKPFAYVVGVITILYGIFVMKIIGKPISTHIHDVWNSKEMREKRTLVSHELYKWVPPALTSDNDKREKQAQVEVGKDEE